MARRLFSNAVRVYLINLLQESKAALAMHEEQAVISSSSPVHQVVYETIVDHARRVVDGVMKLQYEDSCGIHPYFTAASLAAIDRAQQALLAWVLAAKHIGRGSYPSLKIFARNASEIVTYSIRYIVEERSGDVALSSLSMQAIARIDSARDVQLVSAPLHVKEALSNVQRIQSALAFAKSKGWVKIEQAWKQALYLTRAAELDALTTAAESHLDRTSLALTRAAEYQIQAAELLTLRRRMDVSISSGAIKLIAAAANAYKDAADLCNTVKLSRSNDVCTSDEMRVDRLVKRGRRLHNDALSLSQLQQDLDDQAAGEVAVNTACCACKHPGLASALAQLGEEYRSAKELTEEYLHAVLAERSDDPNVCDLGLMARNKRLKNYKWKVLLTEVVGKLVKMLHLCTARAAALQGETAPCLVAARECWEAAASNLTILVDSELDRRWDLLLAADMPTALKSENETYCAAADYYVGIAKGVLALAAEYQRSAEKVVGTGENIAARRECWREACKYATAAAREDMRAVRAALADSRTGSVRPNMRCPQAGALEDVATAFARAAQQSVGTLVVNSIVPGSVAMQLAELEGQTFAALVARAQALAVIASPPGIDSEAEAEQDPLPMVRSRLAAAETELRVLECYRKALLSPATQPSQSASTEVEVLRHCTVWARKPTANSADRADARQTGLWRLAVERSVRAMVCAKEGASTEALLNHHAAYLVAGAAEALEAGMMWDSTVLESAAKALQAAADSKRATSGKFEIMYALHVLIAQQLLQSARDVTDAFVPSAVCPLSPLPTVEANDVQHYASDITRTILDGANCRFHSAKSIHARLWDTAAALAAALQGEKIAEVQELSLRESEDTCPSKFAGAIARMELLLQTRIRYAMSLDAHGDYPRTEPLWTRCLSILDKPLIDVRRPIVDSCVRAFVDAATALENGEIELGEAAEQAALAAVWCFQRTGGTASSEDRLIQHNVYLNLKIAEARLAEVRATLAGEDAAAALWRQAQDVHEQRKHLLAELGQAATRRERKSVHERIRGCKAQAAALEARAMQATPVSAADANVK